MKIKRNIALLLIFCLLITSTHGFAFASVYDGKGEYFTKDQMGEWKWEDYKKYYGIPLLTPYKNPKNFFFNIELWQDLNITAYGDYSKVPRNDFKNATLRGYSGGDLTEGIKNKGYYEKDGQLGEYRYHGYDAYGNPYVNLHFPADSDSGRKPEAKKWIYRVWDSSSPYFLNASGQKRIDKPSDYYKLAIDNSEPTVAANTKAMIAETLPFNIVASTNANKEAYNYVHVDTAPTTRFGGEGLMYHQSDIVYYQKFSLNKIVQSKLNLPMKASVQASYQGVSLAEDLAKKIDLVFDVKVSGVLQDDALFGSATTYEGVPIDVAKTNYYTRLDIKNWTLKVKDTLTNKYITLNNVQPSKNIGEGIFEVKIPYDAYKGQLNLNSDAPKDITVNFEGDAIANFYNNESLQDKAKTSVSDVSAPNIIVEITGDPSGGTYEEIPHAKYEPLVLEIEAPRHMLDTETFKIVNSSEVPSGGSVSVTLEGESLSAEESELFLSGQYLFPLIGMDQIYTYTVILTNQDGKSLRYSSYIYVYTVKPKTQFKTAGTFKENRKITVTADYERNSAYLREKVTFDILKFNASTLKSNNIFFRTQNASVLEFIVKDEDMLNLSMQIQSNVPAQYIERSDIPNGYMISNVFDQEIQVHRDYEPAIIANIWSSVMIRGESLDLQYDASSYDGDLISKNNYKIYYDQNQDGVPEQLVKQGKWSEYTGYVANKLGTYKIVFDIEESFGEATLEEFISAGDLRKTTTERFFYVENVAPVTAIETDIPVEIEKVDVFVLNDQDITREMNNDIKNKRVDWINALQFESGVSANLQIWDLHTYIESKPMSLSVNTGGYPPTTYNYLSEGWSGTLTRLAGGVRDLGGYQDFGSSQPNKVCVDVPVYKSVWNGHICGWITGDGFDGTIAASCLVQDGTKKECETFYEWVPDQQWVSNYYGDYSGVVTKPTKQVFNPTINMNTEKYVVYFANNTIKNKADFDALRSRMDSKVILVGTNNLKNQLGEIGFVNINQPLDAILEQVNKLIAENESVIHGRLLLVNQTFSTMFSDFDIESDTLINLGLQYVHDPNYYDNNMGLESGASKSFSESGFMIQTAKTAFTKVGYYQIFRQVKDQITGFKSHEELSNIARTDIYVHRQPIADFTLDWDYNTDTNSYKTTWVDLSYDLDHQFSDAQKGIRDRRIMYRKTSEDNVWIYAIPDNLTHGTYEVRYTVKDIEGVWSEPATKIYTLTAEPPIRLSAQLKPHETKFQISSLPASEALSLFDLKTIYHRAHQLKITIHRLNGQTLREEALLFSTEMTKYNKEGDNYNWVEQILKTAPQWSDGKYYVKIEARSTSAPIVTSVLELPFQIETPIWIKGAIDELMPGEMVSIRAVTNKYAQSARVQLMSGTAYALEVPLKKAANQTDAEEISWESAILLPENIPDGMYEHRFVAETASGKEAFDQVALKVEGLKIQSFELKGYWSHWRGQVDLFGKQMLNMPHRLLSYEKVVFTARVKGRPESVYLDLSPELKAMSFTNRLNQTYRYKDETGYEVSFPLQMVMLSEEGNLSVWEVEYIIPLCLETLSETDARLRLPYFAEVIASKGKTKRSAVINDIEITGNIFDHFYMQPEYK